MITSDIHNFFERTRRNLSAPDPEQARHALASQADWYRTSIFGIRCFYVILLALAFQIIEDWQTFVSLYPATELIFSWQVAWVPWIGVSNAAGFLHLGLLLASLAAIWNPRSVLFRAAAAIFLLECISLRMAAIGHFHAFHALAWTTLVFVFLPLPAERANRRARQAVLDHLYFARASLFLFYGFTGLWKVVEAVKSMFAGGVATVVPDIGAQLIADRLLFKFHTTFAGPFLVEHPWWSFTLYILHIYVELAAVVVAFRPQIWAYWGVLLLLFHSGILLSMNIAFGYHAALIALLFIILGHPRRIGWGAAFRQFPLVYGLRRGHR